MNEYQLRFTEYAESTLKELKDNPSKKRIAKAAFKALQLMRTNLRHPSLHTHKYDEIIGYHDEEVFESYAQNKTPGAYRIFWHYGPGKGVITILGIEPHP